MTDPTRFTEREPESPEAMLLGSMRSDAPPNGSKKALLGALGVGAMAGLTGAAAASNAASGFTGLVTTKWLGVLGICGVAVGVGYAAWQAASSEPSGAMPAIAGVPDRSSAALSSPAQPMEQPPVVGLPSATELSRHSPPNEARAANDSRPGASSAVAIAKLAPSAGRRPAPRSSAAPGLSDEVAALERARRALSEADNATALKALSEYDRQFSQGTLGPEAEVLRIEAVLRNGNKAAGKALGQRFLARFPNSPLAARVRSLLAEAAGSR